MRVDSWEWTILGKVHQPIEQELNLEGDEYPVASFFCSSETWSLYTTHGIYGKLDSRRIEVDREQFEGSDFGDFKQDLDSPRVGEARLNTREGKKFFAYETGYASMAPIHYFKFWILKWPAWRRAYQLLMEQAEEAEQDVTPKSDRAGG